MVYKNNSKIKLKSECTNSYVLLLYTLGDEIQVISQSSWRDEYCTSSFTIVQSIVKCIFEKKVCMLIFFFNWFWCSPFTIEIIVCTGLKGKKRGREFQNMVCAVAWNHIYNIYNKYKHSFLVNWVSLLIIQLRQALLWKPCQLLIQWVLKIIKYSNIFYKTYLV